MSYQSKHTGAAIDAGIDAANAALPKSGGTMTGALILNANPTSNLGAVTKQYVDDVVGNIASTPGPEGKSAYQIALEEGFEGSEEEWLASLKGEDGVIGKDGEPGKDGVSPTVEVEPISGGHCVTITDATGPKSFNVMNGVDGSGGDGSGDMLKAVYDSNNNGVVDDSEKLGGKTPDQYASANHAHEEYANAEHDHDIFIVGESGFVPAPTVDAADKYLCGDGSWKAIESGDSVGSGDPSVHVGENEPTSEAVQVWIETDSEESYCIPEIKDNEISTVDTWSSAKINRAISYTTAEQPTGGTWIDGKPIYKRVISVTATKTNTWYSSDAIGNVDAVVKYYTVSNGPRHIQNASIWLSESRFTNTYLARQDDDTSSIKLAFWTNSEHHIGTTTVIVYYTKTTD